MLTMKQKTIPTNPTDILPLDYFCQCTKPAIVDGYYGEYNWYCGSCSLILKMVKPFPKSTIRWMRAAE